MGRLITMRDGKVVEDRQTPDPPAPNVDDEIAELKARLAALEEQAAKP